MSKLLSLRFLASTGLRQLPVTTKVDVAGLRQLPVTTEVDVKM